MSVSDQGGVSVIMPVYNGVDYLEASIRSIIQQEFRDFELIIINDGSTEDVLSIIGRFSDARIRVYSRENMGLGRTLNELASLARGEFIIRMDADDISLPTRIGEQVAFLKANSDVSMVGTGISFLVGSVEVSTFSPIMAHKDIMSALRNMRFSVCHPSIAFRKSSFLAVGGYRIGGAGEDLDFFIRMGEVGRLANIGKTLLLYRLHNASLALSKEAELNKGYAYALASAKSRAGGRPDLTQEAFERIWKNRGLKTKLYFLAHNISERLYRSSITSRAQERYPLMVAQIGTAMALRPVATAARVKQLLRKCVSSRREQKN